MRHSNVSVFVSHIGCPNRCSFCNQHTISGCSSVPTAEDVRKICEQALLEVSDRKNCEIAFFGGSFTAIKREYMISLLKAANEFLGENGFYGIRISTRPDCVDEEVLEILKSYGVTAVELGAQSMKNSVLLANDRGHTAEDVCKASELVKEYGFELGLQMMTGLYKSSPQDDLETMERIIAVKPQTVRIYPTVVLEGTKLAQLYESGEYRMISFDEMVELCAKILVEFDNAGIKVIRCGLHASDNVEGKQVAGYYHPAFRELCESFVYRRKISELISHSAKKDAVKIAVSPSCVSRAVGHKKSNYEYFKKLGIDIKIVQDKSVGRFQCLLRR